MEPPVTAQGGLLDAGDGGSRCRMIDRESRRELSLGYANVYVGAIPDLSQSNDIGHYEV